METKNLAYPLATIRYRDNFRVLPFIERPPCAGEWHDLKLSIFQLRLHCDV